MIFAIVDIIRVYLGFHIWLWQVEHLRIHFGNRFTLSIQRFSWWRWMGSPQVACHSWAVSFRGRGTLRHGWMDRIHKLLCWLLAQAYVLPFSLRDTKVAMEAVECHEDLMEAKFQACHPTSNTRIAIQNQEFSTNSTSWHFMIMILHASSQHCLEDLQKTWKFLLIPVPFPFVPTSAPSTVGWGELEAPECVLERWGSTYKGSMGWCDLDSRNFVSQ